MTPPQTLLAGRYRLLEPIGQGGMGRVWLATDEFLTRQVAVKEVVAPQGLTAAEVRDMGARALREARAAARLSHPNVVTVYDIVVTDTAPWIVMEYLQCRSLYEVVSQDGPLPVAEAAQMGLAVLTALRAAHGVGVLHRDVKPGNVLIDQGGRTVLTDFGLATIVGDPSVTRSGMIIGSPSYMAPERARDAEAGEAADLWSLGATLYFAVEGRSPYERSSALATVAALASEEPDPAVRSGRLKPVLNGLLRRNPAARLDPQTLERMLRVIARNASVKPGVAKYVHPVGVSKVGLAAVGGVKPTLAEAIHAAPTKAPPANTAAPANTVPAPASVVPAPANAVPADAVRTDGARADAPPGDGAPSNAQPAAVAEAVTKVAWDAPAPPPRGARTARVKALWSPVGRALPVRLRRLWAVVRVDRRAWALAIAVAVVLVAVATWSAASPSGSVSSGTAPQSPPPMPSSGQPGASAAQPSAAGTPRQSASGTGVVLPAGWRMYTDPTGFSVAVNASWTVSRQGTIVYFRDTNGGPVLGIDQTDSPIADPVADWRSKERYRVDNGDFPGYHRVRLVDVNYFTKAADWEFTYFRDGSAVHANNRGFIVSPTKAYGMWWSTPAEQWDQYHADLDLIQRSFIPAR
jgi:hypothetical protein